MLERVVSLGRATAAPHGPIATAGLGLPGTSTVGGRRTAPQPPGRLGGPPDRPPGQQRPRRPGAARQRRPGDDARGAAPRRGRGVERPCASRSGRASAAAWRSAAASTSGPATPARSAIRRSSPTARRAGAGTAAAWTAWPARTPSRAARARPPRPRRSPPRAGRCARRRGAGHRGPPHGLALAGAVVLLWPQRIVVGGGLAAAGELLLGPLRESSAPARASHLRSTSSRPRSARGRGQSARRSLARSRRCRRW